jgi:hypothetical protein
LLAANSSGSIPAVPSLIVTVQQVMYTQLGPTGFTGPTGVTGITGPTGPGTEYWSPTGPTGIYYNNPIISYGPSGNSVRTSPTGTVYVKAAIQESVGYLTGSTGSPFNYTLWSDYNYQAIYISSGSINGTIGTINLPNLSNTGLDDGRYVEFRKTGTTSGPSTLNIGTQVVKFNSNSKNIIGLDVTLLSSNIAQIYNWGGPTGATPLEYNTQTNRKFTVASVGGTGYWFITNNA